MLYSIITPIWVGEDNEKERRLTLFRDCCESVLGQDFKDFEWIIVNDGSTVGISVPRDNRVRVISQGNFNRIVSFETGLRESKGEWICFLDSDDRYKPNYLSTFESYIQKYPQYNIFNCGNDNIHHDGEISYRNEFRPKRKKVGHEVFSGGQIVNGTFIFSRKAYKDVGGFPPQRMENVDCTSINYPAYADQPEPYIRDLHMTSPYDFSAAAQLEFPELQKYYMVKHPDHPKNLVKEFGNPWGNDFYYFYKLTRKYHSKPIPEKLLVVNLKA